MPDSYCKNFPTLDIEDNMFVCSGYKEHGRGGACSGDSGGPLVCPLKEDPNVWSLVGITSFATYSCGLAPNHPTYFTHVFNYKNWIDSVSGE